MTKNEDLKPITVYDELFSLVESQTGKVLLHSEMNDIIIVVEKYSPVFAPTDGEVERAIKTLEHAYTQCQELQKRHTEIGTIGFDMAAWISEAIAVLQSTHKPDVKDFKIGEYTLTNDPQHGLMIYHESGEGGQFKIDALAKVVDKFYKENF